jgi:hypothetical protein
VLAACIAVVAALVAFYGVRWRAKEDAKQARLDRDAEADRAAADRKAAMEQARRAEQTNVVTRVVDVTQALIMSTSRLVAARLADADADVMAEENEVGEKASETLLLRDLLLLWASSEAATRLTQLVHDSTHAVLDERESLRDCIPRLMKSREALIEQLRIDLGITEDQG